MSPFFVPVIPLSSSPSASLRVEVKNSCSYWSPQNIGEKSARRELNMSIFFTIYLDPASFAAFAVRADCSPSFASWLSGMESSTRRNSFSASL